MIMFFFKERSWLTFDMSGAGQRALDLADAHKKVCFNALQSAENKASLEAAGGCYMTFIFKKILADTKGQVHRV